MKTEEQIRKKIKQKTDKVKNLQAARDSFVLDKKHTTAGAINTKILDLRGEILQLEWVLI